MSERNDPTSTLSRRRFFGAAAGAAAAVGGAALLAACGKGGGEAAAFKCTDTAGLAEPDKLARMNNGYVDKAPDAKKNCANCSLYQAAAKAGSCGACTVVKGPIHPDGYCNLWVAKPA